MRLLLNVKQGWTSTKQGLMCLAQEHKAWTRNLSISFITDTLDIQHFLNGSLVIAMGNEIYSLLSSFQSYQQSYLPYQFLIPFLGPMEFSNK